MGLLSIHATAHTGVPYKDSVYHSSRGHVTLHQPARTAEAAAFLH